MAWSALGGRRFAIAYVAIAGALLALYSLPYRELGISERWFDAYLRGYARLSGSVLGIFDSSVTVSGTTILGRFPLQIVKTCDAIEIKILLASAILALPSVPLARRALAAGFAVLTVVGINVTRIASLYFVGVHFPGAFERLHLEVWPLALVVVAALEFLLLARFLERYPGRVGA